MITYSQIEQALIKLGYTPDSNFQKNSKLTTSISVDGYKFPAVLEFREAWQSQLGNVEQLFQIEWLMDDGENFLLIDVDSLNLTDDEPSIFFDEKLLLRKIFDQILEELTS
ncbi:MAG: hypothetical protein AUK48_06000 [Oscillatoriales cyanobacterium CG2_30_44_21]|nr:MAG: hypothetical protein AUK48_06000 [Oscillatoriales cyanobacterium CG2_30_44_21]